MDLRLAMRPQTVARVPQSSHDARRDPSRPAGALIGSVRRDPLGREAVDAAVCVVTRDFVKSTVDDGRDPGHRERRLRDIRRDDDATMRRGSERGVLGVEMEAAVLFTIGALRSVKAGCLLTVSDIVIGEEFTRISDDELRAAVDRMTRVALTTVTH